MKKELKVPPKIPKRCPFIGCCEREILEESFEFCEDGAWIFACDDPRIKNTVKKYKRPVSYWFAKKVAEAL